MHRHSGTLLALALLAACSAPTERTVAPILVEGGSLSVAQAPLYMVTLRDDVADVRAVARELGARGGFGILHVREHAARGFDAIVPPGALAALRADPRVLLVEADGPISLDLPREAARPGGGGGGGQQTSWGLGRVGGAGDGTGRTAWIIDSGIDLAHPDLNTGRACHASFVARGDSTPSDGNGHGTHVAGIVAARNNTIGTLGVAANAYVCAVRVLDNSGSGQWSWVVNGVNYVAGAAASGDVANMSLGAAGSVATLETAIRNAAQKGIKFVLAAGNSGMDASGYTPARTDGSNVYTISAINSTDCMPSWSNYGNPPVDYAAPGVGILSTYKGGGTKSLSGTSMAAPHVAGILLLGNVRASGSASCDPDDNPDPIASR